jgi:tetratricopeptide (TPR) repeat protein/tRNA A-37 threonylcarbamoyl transferase component Bud32
VEDSLQSSLSEKFEQVRTETSVHAIKDRVEERLFGAGSRPKGRYVLVEEVGRGGLGVVVRAYDPKLRREVALKSIRTDRMGPRAQARLVREAQAMAQLSHPNVAAVYDVGLEEDTMVLAMEFVAGKTLREWFAERARSWSDVLEVVTAAGRGLAAAHAAGLVHRDFKPDNAIVGDDGRVRVVDFGLARAIESSEERGAPPEPAGDGELDDALTWPGALTGTPAYMAPEQFMNEPTDARTDQFALCVTLWEGLFGERPFAGATIAELAASVLVGELRPIPPQARVPAWLRKIVRRGLSRDPAARWPTTTALLDAIDRSRGRARRVAIAAGVVVLASFALWGAGARELFDRRRVAACDEEGETIHSSWNDDARSHVRAGLRGSGASDAEAIADRVMPWLDDYAGAWQRTRAAVCVDARVHERLDADAEARALWCLEERRGLLDAVVDELARVDAHGAIWAVSIAAGMPAMEPCLDAGALSRSPLPASELRGEVQAARSELLRALYLRVAGRFTEAEALADRVLVHAEALGWPPLAVEARVRRADILYAMGEPTDAAHEAELAYFAALSAGAYALAEQAATLLVLVVGDDLGQHAEGLRWAKHAEAALALAGNREELRLAALALNRATVHAAAGELADARALAEQALAMREAVLGPEHPLVANSLQTLASVHQSLGDNGESRRLLERALTIRERTVGRDHPDYAATLGNLANAHQLLGDLDSAERLHEESIAINERVFGRDHPKVAMGLMNLAGDYFQTRRVRESMQLLERALAIQEKTLGAEHPDVASTLGNLAFLHTQLNQPDIAAPMLRRAVAILEKAHGTRSPALASLLTAVGMTEMARGAHDDAIAHYRRVLEIREQAVGPDHMMVGEVLALLAAAEQAAGNRGEAEALAVRAASVYAKFLGIRHPRTLEVLAELASIRAVPGVKDRTEAAKASVRSRAPGG